MEHTSINIYIRAGHNRPLPDQYPRKCFGLIRRYKTGVSSETSFGSHTLRDNINIACAYAASPTCGSNIDHCLIEFTTRDSKKLAATMNTREASTSKTSVSSWLLASKVVE
jgi:hypothetical protein